MAGNRVAEWKERVKTGKSSLRVTKVTRERVADLTERLGMLNADETLCYLMDLEAAAEVMGLFRPDWQAMPRPTPAPASPAKAP